MIIRQSLSAVLGFVLALGSTQFSRQQLPQTDNQRNPNKPTYGYQAIPLGVRRYQIDGKTYKFDGLLVNNSGKSFLVCVDRLYELQDQETAQDITARVRNLRCPRQDKIFKFQVLD